MKVYILYANENWITDTLVQEWITYNKELYTTDLQQADTIWIFSHYIAKQIPLHIYKSKKVITTIHHLVPSKINTSTFKHFLFLNSITDFFHTNSYKNSFIIQKYIQKPIKIIPLWHNENIWKFLNNKNGLRKKHNFDGFLIGSFQRDTEGASIKNCTFKPKLEKGPDIFIQCLLHLQKTHKNIKVLLTGTRRQYVIKELKKNNIPYFYF